MKIIAIYFLTIAIPTADYLALTKIFNYTHDGKNSNTESKPGLPHVRKNFKPPLRALKTFSIVITLSYNNKGYNNKIKIKSIQYVFMVRTSFSVYLDMVAIARGLLR